MSKLLKNFWANEQGATAIEYGLIASMVSIAAIFSLTTVGTKLSYTFNSVATQLK
jgi:pilus assembly protein Flp/PilA